MAVETPEVLDPLGLTQQPQAPAVGGEGIVQQLQALIAGAQQEPEEERFLTQGDIVSMILGIPANEFASISEQIREPLQPSTSPRDVLALQQNLIAAGYISKERARLLDPGWYDGETMRAYATLLMDARVRQQHPQLVLQGRMAMRGTLAQGLAESPDEAQHLADLDRGYRNAWAAPPPPGYLESVKSMNPQELEAYERSKDTWSSSSVAQSEATMLKQQLVDWASRATGKDLRLFGGEVE